MTHPPTPRAGSRLAQIGPALLGASSFACADVLSKVTLSAGADVLTVSAVRGVLGLAILFVWLRLDRRPRLWPARDDGSRSASACCSPATCFSCSRRSRRCEVPIAILTYFVYPLLTGLAAAATGLESITWRGAAAALAAFLGLALMIGAHPTALAIVGIARRARRRLLPGGDAAGHARDAHGADAAADHLVLADLLDRRCSWRPRWRR